MKLALYKTWFFITALALALSLSACSKPAPGVTSSDDSYKCVMVTQ